MTTDSVATPASKPRWGESEEDDAEGLDYLLPPKQIIGPDENGIEKVIEFKYNDEGNMVKITTTTQAQKLPEARLSKRAIERRSWPKFGDAVREDVGSRLTMLWSEEIFLERPRPTGTNVEEEAKAADARSAVVCRTCGKNHWTSKCPNKDLALQTDTLVENPPISDATKGAYVPPSMRSGADKRRRNDENSVRVANLSDDTREPDLMELFRPFGAVTRVYVVTDQKTGLSRGFGFVNFANKEDAQRAINKLNGYGYDNLILLVEWATPRSN